MILAGLTMVKLGPDRVPCAIADCAQSILVLKEEQASNQLTYSAQMDFSRCQSDFVVYSGRLRLLVVALGSLMVLASCGGSFMGYDPHACDGSKAPGVWNVSLDYGGGKTGTQRWTISRDYCTLTIVAEPTDEYSPGVGADAFGDAFPDLSFRAQWKNAVGSCDYWSDLTATISADGNSFTGPIDWSRIRNSTAGECVQTKGQIMVTAVRLV